MVVDVFHSLAVRRVRRNYTQIGGNVSEPPWSNVSLVSERLTFEAPLANTSAYI